MPNRSVIFTSVSSLDSNEGLPSYEEAMSIAQQSAAEGLVAPMTEGTNRSKTRSQQRARRNGVIFLTPPAAVRSTNRSIRLMCPTCHTVMSTRTEYHLSMKNYCTALVLCFLGCCCFACVPYMGRCSDTRHYCEACGVYLGTYRPAD